MALSDWSNNSQLFRLVGGGSTSGLSLWWNSFQVRLLLFSMSLNLSMDQCFHNAHPVFTSSRGANTIRYNISDINDTRLDIHDASDIIRHGHSVESNWDKPTQTTNDKGSVAKGQWSRVNVLWRCCFITKTISVALLLGLALLVHEQWRSNCSGW